MEKAIISNKFVIIPESYVENYDLPSNRVDLKHFEELWEIQKDSDLKLAPKLQEEYLNGKNHHQVLMWQQV